MGNGHEAGWDATDETPRELHKRATERDEAAMRRVAKVEDYLTRHGVRLAAVDVFVHQGFGTVQIATTGYIDDWGGFSDTVGVEGIWYDPKRDVNVCTDEFVAQLPAFGDGGGS